MPFSSRVEPDDAVAVHPGGPLDSASLAPAARERHAGPAPDDAVAAHPERQRFHQGRLEATARRGRKRERELPQEGARGGGTG